MQFSHFSGNYATEDPSQGFAVLAAGLLVAAGACLGAAYKLRRRDPLKDHYLAM